MSEKKDQKKILFLIGTAFAAIMGIYAKAMNEIRRDLLETDNGSDRREENSLTKPEKTKNVNKINTVQNKAD